MVRLSTLSCRSFFLMYAQTFLMTSVRGSGAAPTILASASVGVMAFMKPAFGFRADFLAAVFFAAGFLVVGFLVVTFFAAGFLVVAFFAAGFLVVVFLVVFFLVVAIVFISISNTGS